MLQQFSLCLFWFYAAAFLGASCGGGGGDGGVVVMFLEFSLGETLPLYRWVKKTAAAKYRTYYCCNMFNVAACLAETYLISGGVKQLSCTSNVLWSGSAKANSRELLQLNPCPPYDVPAFPQCYKTYIRNWVYCYGRHPRTFCIWKRKEIKCIWLTNWGLIQYQDVYN